MRYLVNISYDGSDYYGFQIQKNKKTIEGEIESVLSKILNDNINIIGCSRTDKGVHAKDFYFHFDTLKEINIDKLMYALNRLTTDNIYIRNIRKVEDNFHARYNVINKEYVYVINMGEYTPYKRNIELEYNKSIDIDKLKIASKYLIGEHNFKSFTSGNEVDNYVRKINYINFEVKNDILKIYINGNGFLKYMVRNIVGLFLNINENKISIEDIPNIMDSLDRSKLGEKVSSSGLFLNKVNYK